MVKVSVLMTVYNGEKYLEEAIKSILNQTLKEFELIIVDDGSTDKSFELLKRYEKKDSRIKVVSLKRNGGVAKARNQGLDVCSGDYVAIMDADDIAFPNRLEEQYKYLMEHPDIDAVYARYQILKAGKPPLDSSYPQVFHNPRYLKAYMILNNTIVNPCTLFRKSIVTDNHLKYDEDCKIASDYKFWCEYIQYGGMAGMDQVLLYYRLSDKSLYTGALAEEREKWECRVKRSNFLIYGFAFTEAQIRFLLKMFVDEGRISSIEELNQLYTVLQEMISQAQQKEMDCLEEIKIMCRKRFAEKVSHAFGLWE